MTPTTVKCHVCGISCARPEWIDHLVSKTHLRRSRKDIGDWTEEEKTRSLFLFSNFPLVDVKSADGGTEGTMQDKSGVVAMLQQCAQGRFSISNFVVWEEKPYLGVLQFQNRRTIDLLINGLQKGGRNPAQMGMVWLDDQHIAEPKRMSDYTQEELLEMLPTIAQLERRNLLDDPGPLLDSSLVILEENQGQAEVPLGQEIVTLEDDGHDDSVMEVEVDVVVVGGGNGPSSVPSRTAQLGCYRTELELLALNKTQKLLVKQAAQRRDWKPPKYTFVRASEGRGWICEVAMNGVPYLQGSACSTQTEAMNVAISLCWDKLTSCDVQTRAPPQPQQQRVPVPPPPPLLSPSLADQFTFLRDVVAIPDQPYQNALMVLSSIKSLFDATDAVQVALFRNWHLQLRNPVGSQDEMLVYICTSYPWMINLSTGPFTVLPQSPEGQGLGVKAVCNHNGVTFRLVTLPDFLVEAQMCRLVDYLLAFDPRCIPLMTLVYYWAAVNASAIGENNPLEPITLQWLVIFFLCLRKIVPTPREVQSVTHLLLTDGLSGTDVGFSTDFSMVQQWIMSKRSNEALTEEQGVIKALDLFQDLLTFYGKTLASDQWILNTRDGELISARSFTAGNFTTAMTHQDYIVLRCHPCVQAVTQGIANKPCKLHMVNPFNFASAMCLSSPIQQVGLLMKTTGSRLGEFLSATKKHGVNAATVQYGALGQLLKVTH